jgi:hypothetical protein
VAPGVRLNDGGEQRGRAVCGRTARTARAGAGNRTSTVSPRQPPLCARRVLSIVSAVGRRLVLILSLGCDGGPGVASAGRRSRWPGGRAVVVGTGVGEHQPGMARACSRRTPSLTRSAQGALVPRRRRTCRPARAIVAGRVNRGSRNRFSSQPLAWCPLRASICIHAVISTARARWRTRPGSGQRMSTKRG